MFFDDSSRIKIDYYKGLVRLSLKSSDYSVDEFTIPFSEFDSFYDKATDHKDFESHFIKIKWMAREAIIQIRESKYKRRIFKLSEVRINKILSQFGAQKVSYLNWLTKNNYKAHELTKEYLYKEEEEENKGEGEKNKEDKGEVLAKKLEEKIDTVIGICIKLSESVGHLSTKIKELEHKTQNVVITSSSVLSPKIDEIDFSFKDDEHFIPSDINTDFKGTMTSESISSEDSVMDAAEALKKLRRRQK